MGSGRKRRRHDREKRQGGNERALSQGIYSIDRLLLPINYPQKLFEPDTRKTGMGGEIGREESCGSGGGGAER